MGIEGGENRLEDLNNLKTIEREEEEELELEKIKSEALPILSYIETEDED